jgi:protein-disulfide isomerase
MANKTRQQSKSERAQALMREQKRKERTRNWFVVGAVVLAIAIIAGVMFAVTNKNDKTGQAVSSSGTPSNLSGAYNVVIGKSTAPTTIKLYEDLQCPICKAFEAVTGAKTEAAIKAGKVKVDYHMVAFLDSNSTTNYSSRALNAAMAVLSTAGPDAFMKFRTIAFDNQPAEGTAGVPDSTLIQWAVQAGADEAAVTPLIDGNVYHQWVLNATDQMSKDGVNGTPTVYINDKLQGGTPPSPQVAAEAVLAAVK